VVLTDWPPGPEEQKVSTRKSFASILISISSASGRTATVCRGSMNAALRFRGGNALDAMHATFIFQLGINLLPLNRGDDFLEAADGRRRAFQDFDFPALRFGVAGIHAEEFGGKESGFVAAGAGADFHDDALVVEGIFREEQEFQFALGHLLARGEFFLFVVAICFIRRLPLRETSGERRRGLFRSV